MNDIFKVVDKICLCLYIMILYSKQISLIVMVVPLQVVHQASQFLSLKKIRITNNP